MHAPRSARQPAPGYSGHLGGQRFAVERPAEVAPGALGPRGVGGPRQCRLRHGPQAMHPRHTAIASTRGMD
eukprot:8050863-Lingulodinium_polyedra.AAC.1